MISPEAAQFIAGEKVGNARMIGNNLKILTFSAKDRMYISARRHACPRPDATVAYYGSEWLKYWRGDLKHAPTEQEIEEHGIEITRRRYDECDFVTGDIIAKVRAYPLPKKRLLKSLTVSVPRNDGEPAGVSEPGSVPRSHKKIISPRSSQVGYALARVLIEQYGWGSDTLSWGDSQRTWERYAMGLDMLDDAITHSQTALELLAILAEKVTNEEEGGVANKDKVLGHIFAEGILEEENNYTERRNIESMLEECAPNLYDYYVNLYRR